MKSILAFLLFSTPTFAFEQAVDLKQSEDLAQFTVILQGDQSDKKDVHCTGVIISNTQILTLNYCVDQYGYFAKNYWVHFGVDGRNPIDVRMIKTISAHPLALRNNYRHTPYDVAIIELDGPIPAGFKPVNISSYLDSELISKLPFDTYLVGAGGSSGTYSTGYTSFNRLRYVKQAGILENFYPLYKLFDSYAFCLDDETTGFDWNDLGGPVVFEENGQYQLIGLVSGEAGTSSDFQVPGTCANNHAYSNRTSVQPINMTAEWILGKIIP